MVSTHQQYLCPDFLNPSPPATMDSSPLALLAQTCNSIGLPDPPSSANSSSNAANSKSNSKSDAKSSSESTKNQTKDEILSKKKTTTSAADSSSDASSIIASATVRSSPASKEASGTHSPETSRKVENRSRNGNQNGNVSSTDNGKTPDNNSELKSNSATAPISLPSTSASAVSSSYLSKCVMGSMGSNPLAGFPAGAFPPSLFPPYYAANSAPTGVYPYGTSAHLPSMAFAGSCYPPFPTSMPTASNPWLAPSLPGFAPKCTDPFCKTCPAVAGAVRGSCGASGCPCLQCGGGHSTGDLPFWLSSYGSLLSQTVGMHGFGSPMATNSASVYAAAAAAAAAAAQQQANINSMTNVSTSTSIASQSQPQQQHTCSWMTGSEFCGKRFPSSEELLQHLRSHTSHDSAAAANANANANLAAATANANATNVSSAVGGGGRLSPRSAYLSSLNSLRYHPYGKLTPSSAAAALASFPFPSPVAALNSTPNAFNPLSALCSSLSAQRLPASLPHP